MKALLYKEFKLAMHPICYLFVFLFPLMILIPSYPAAVGFIYVLSCYPILFLGANKGQQSNDLLYSTLLPIRKKDIVLARIITISIMQFTFMALMSALLPAAMVIHETIKISGGTPTTGLPLYGFGSTLAFAIIGYTIADLIFFPIYYKNGKSIVLSTLMTILGFTIYIMFVTVVIPYIPGAEGYVNFFSNSPWIQIGFLAIALLIYIGLHYLIYRISAKRLERVDF